MSDATTDDGENSAGDHDTYIRSTVLSLDHEYDLRLVFGHKTDGIANCADLTFEQVAMLQDELAEMMDDVNEDFEIKRSVIEDATRAGRGYQ